MHLPVRMKELDNSLIKLSRDFNAVNSGGCACVAAMVATKLRSEFPIMRITSSGTWGRPNLDEIRESNIEYTDGLMCKDDWYANNISFEHVWVEVQYKGRWYVLDSTGVTSRKGMYKQWGTPAEGSFSIEETMQMASEDSWNRRFDRDQLPAMQKLITNTVH